MDPIRVDFLVEAAFRLFTADIRRWLPLTTHSVDGQNVERCILEERVGGRFYELNRDGSQTDWGRVLAWEPPQRVAFTLHPGRTPEYATDVEVAFAALRLSC